MTLSFAAVLPDSVSAFSSTWVAVVLPPRTNDDAQSKYDLTLVASDSLNESVTRVTILIKDANDLPPVFNQTAYTGHLPEEMNDPLPFRLLQVVGGHVKRP